MTKKQKNQLRRVCGLLAVAFGVRLLLTAIASDAELIGAGELALQCLICATGLTVCTRAALMGGENV